mgnify:CR=1 FL=1
MTRAQRRIHAAIWVVLVPVLIVIVLLAAESRVDEPVKDFSGQAFQNAHQAHGGTE